MLRHLQMLYDAGTLTGLADQELLARFQSASRDGDREGAEFVLGTLIERHAAMVWGVCRGLVRDPNDAEDAYQATFLILVRKAGSIRIRESLGSWLYVVACRAALSIRSAAARQRKLDRAAARSRAESINRPEAGESEGSDHDVLAVIHSEIMRLPRASRAVVVLCDLEGLSYREAAGRLNLPLGTLQSRLARARQRLRRRLTVRGIRTPAGSGDSSPGSAFGMVMTSGLPRTLVPSVRRLCVTGTAHSAGMATIVEASVQTLIRRGLRSMLYSHAKLAVLILLGPVLVCGALLYADATSGQPGQDGQPPQPGEAKEKARVRKDFVIPAPRRLRVAAGRGRILMYALDAKHERIRLRPADPASAAMEVERESRWAVVTGIIDHRRVQWWFRDGGRFFLPTARHIYLRVDLQRQDLQDDGKWSGWKPVDMVSNLTILDNVPEVEFDRTPEHVHVQNLVDPLPHLKSGRWGGVYVDELVPATNKATEEVLFGLVGGFGQPGRVELPPEAESPVLMLRTLDFTVESGRTYRYRARVVVHNREWKQGEKRIKRVEFGPWSEMTDVVTVP